MKQPETVGEMVEMFSAGTQWMHHEFRLQAICPMARGGASGVLFSVLDQSEYCERFVHGDDLGKLEPFPPEQVRKGPDEITLLTGELRKWLADAVNARHPLVVYCEEDQSSMQRQATDVMCRYLDGLIVRLKEITGSDPAQP